MARAQRGRGREGQLLARSPVPGAPSEQQTDKLGGADAGVGGSERGVRRTSCPRSPCLRRFMTSGRGGIVLRLGAGSTGVGSKVVVRFDALAGRSLMGAGWLSRWKVGSWKAGKADGASSVAKHVGPFLADAAAPPPRRVCPPSFRARQLPRSLGRCNEWLCDV